MPKKQGSGGGNRKKGRNKVSAAQYESEGRREKNKARRLVRHIKNEPGDAVARRAYESLPLLARNKHRLAAAI